MRELPSRDQVLRVAKELGAVSYSPPPMRAVRGVSFTFQQLDEFVAKMINPGRIVVDRTEGVPASAQEGIVDEIKRVQGDNNER